MKSKIVYFIIFGITMLMISGCVDKSQADFSYEKGGKKITIVLENNAKSLKAGKSNKVRFDTEKINNKKLTIVGAGIKMDQSNENGFHLLITPVEKMLEDGKMKIIITESIENKENFSHTFLVPVKSK